MLEILKAKDEREAVQSSVDVLDLHPVLERSVENLSGGELQRFAIGVCLVQNADVYMFDEPSSYLDVMQRLKAARAIRSLLGEGIYVITVGQPLCSNCMHNHLALYCSTDLRYHTTACWPEHDLSVLDYLSDFICCLYGVPGAYGVVTLPFSVREGINIFLAGFIPTENMRFRETSLTFKVAEQADDRDAGGDTSTATYSYPKMVKTLGDFKLDIDAGTFSSSEILVMLGQNGTGKTTFIRMLAGMTPADGDEKSQVPQLNVSYKPQKIAPKFEGTVRMLLHKQIRDASIHPQFNSDVMKPMLMDPLMDQEVKHLSGGELQRVALTIALGKPADIYLIDEPSAYLDSEQRIVAAKVIKRFIMHAKKTGFIVEYLEGVSNKWPLTCPCLLLLRMMPSPLPPTSVGFRQQARLHHGHLSRRPRRRLRGNTLCCLHRHHTTAASFGDEPIPQVS